jgi:ER degradation enhancer, mannosidase alpha-like 2
MDETDVMKKLILIAIVSLVHITGFTQSSRPMSAADKLAMQNKVKDAVAHAWNGYREHAWGYDDLQPLTKNGRNWHKKSLLMTPVDSYDTFVMLGLVRQASEAKRLIFDSLSFDQDFEVQVFEIVIRLLGGLISAYEVDNDENFLMLATDLAERLAPAFNTPTGMPYRYINLHTGAVRDSINNPAEIGTLMLEFGQLSRITGEKKYYDMAKKAIMAVHKKRSKIGLVGLQINTATGEWVNKESAIGAYIDSYYEYLYKGWRLFGDEDLKAAWDVHKAAISKYMVHRMDSGYFLRQVNMETGKQTNTEYGALDAFYAGLLAYAGDFALAKNNQKANYHMWTKFGMEPESFNYVDNKVNSAYYILRPENIESCFYLYRLTKDNRYLSMGQRMVNDILTRCKVQVGFASLKDVRTGEYHNSMQSFFIAETLKYAYLLFADEEKFDLEKAVFNTEAHPFKIRKVR